ncbi:MAG: DMT family transporter [Pseudomonadota bacterium]
MVKPSPNMIGVLLAATGFLFYAIGDIGFKNAVMQLTVYQVAFYAQAIGLIFLVAYSVFSKKSLKTKKVKLHVMRAIFIAVPYFIAIYAFQHKSLAEAYIFFSLAPFFTGIFASILLKEHFTKHQFFAVLTGFIGVTIILRPGFVEIDWIAVAIIIASISYAYISVVTRRDGEGESELVLSFYVTLGIFLLSIIPFLFDPVIPPSNLYLSLVVAGSFEAVATGLVSLAYLKTRAVTIQKLGYTGLVWAYFLGWIFFDDYLIDGWTLTGAVIIVSSGLYMIYREHRFSQRQQEKEALET